MSSTAAERAERLRLQREGLRAHPHFYRPGERSGRCQCGARPEATTHQDLYVRNYWRHR